MDTLTVPEPRAPLPEMLTIKDVAAYLRVSFETARRIVREPDFPLLTTKNTYRIPRKAFLRWVARRTGQKDGDNL
jgi:excisionase family DNA binding protein